MSELISKKQKKKKKLRHAEYYGMTETFDKLYAESRDGKVFTHLYELVTAEENILLAYRNIKRNKGSTTAGVDRKTILDLEAIPRERFVELARQKNGILSAQACKESRNPEAQRKDPSARHPDDLGQGGSAMYPARAGADLRSKIL